MLTFDKNPPIHYLRLIKKMFVNCWPSGKYVDLLYIWIQYLVEAPFALITASIWRGMEVISLWHCWGDMEQTNLNKLEYGDMPIC